MLLSAEGTFLLLENEMVVTRSDESLHKPLNEG
jgi:hypothetical protein